MKIVPDGHSSGSTATWFGSEADTESEDRQALPEVMLPSSEETMEIAL
jgi:hypothetical protein